MPHNNEQPNVSTDEQQATYFENAPYERQTVSTGAEISDWLENKAVGNSPEATNYLEELKSLADDARQSGDARVLDAVQVLTGQIARRAEQRVAKMHEQSGGTAPIDIEGVDALREVDMSDIMLTTTEFDPQHANFQGYYEGEDVTRIDRFIREALRKDAPEKPQE